MHAFFTRAGGGEGREVCICWGGGVGAGYGHTLLKIIICFPFLYLTIFFYLLITIEDDHFSVVHNLTTIYTLSTVLASFAKRFNSYLNSIY